MSITKQSTDSNIALIGFSCGKSAFWNRVTAREFPYCYSKTSEVRIAEFKADEANVTLTDCSSPQLSPDVNVVLIFTCNGKDPEQWIQLAKTKCPKARVVIVNNQIDKYAHYRHPKFETVNLSCRTWEGFDAVFNLVLGTCEFTDLRTLHYNPRRKSKRINCEVVEGNYKCN